MSLVANPRFTVVVDVISHRVWCWVDPLVTIAVRSKPKGGHCPMRKPRDKRSVCLNAHPRLVVVRHAVANAIVHRVIPLRAREIQVGQLAATERLVLRFNLFKLHAHTHTRARNRTAISQTGCALNWIRQHDHKGQRQKELSGVHTLWRHLGVSQYNTAGQ